MRKTFLYIITDTQAAEPVGSTLLTLKSNIRHDPEADPSTFISSQIVSLSFFLMLSFYFLLFLPRDHFLYMGHPFVICRLP